MSSQFVSRSVDSPVIDEDFSNSFGRIRGDVKNSHGVTLVEFKKTLVPIYRIAYRDIGVGYLAIFSVVALAALAERGGVSVILVSLFVGVLVGYWVAYLQLFIHEGAHWNLAADQADSDLLCNLLISWWTGLEVNAYRRTHFQHHRSLGKIDDSERTYFLPLNTKFLMRGLLGIQALAVIMTRKSAGDRKHSARPGEEQKAKHTRLLTLGVGIIIHAAIVVAMLYWGYVGVAIGWVIGVGSFFPLFGALRQLLEHRSEAAKEEVDYAAFDHGAYTRVFSDGMFVQTFGGAGFNRHLLHHWEPTVSYTRLGDLERFLLDTPMKSIIESRRTTYVQTFWRLFRVR